jgi:shikimate dehydrogenase
MAGSGGVASAIAFALAEAGCRSLRIVNRSAEKAKGLAASIVKLYPNADGRFGDDLPFYDLAINATSLGMLSADRLPFSTERLASAGESRTVSPTPNGRLCSTPQSNGAAR